MGRVHLKRTGRACRMHYADSYGVSPCCSVDDSAFDYSAFDYSSISLVLDLFKLSNSARSRILLFDHPG